MPWTLALPIMIAADGRIAALEQDDPVEVAQSVALLVATRTGERRSVPDYGTPDPLFGGIDTQAVLDAVEEWEDRADDVDIDVDEDGNLQLVAVHTAAAEEDA